MNQFTAVSVRALLPLILIGLAVMGARAIAEEASRSVAQERARLAVDRVVRDLLAPAIPVDAQFYVVDEVRSGTVVVWPQIGSEPVELKLPGPAIFVMVDLAPGQLMEHPILYAAVSADGTYLYTSQEHRSFGVFAGVQRWSLVDLIEHDPAGHGASAYPVALLRPSAITSVAPAPWYEGLASFARRLIEPSAASAAGKRRAVIVDGGDEWIDVPSGLPNTFLLNRLAAIEARRAIRDQAEELGRLVGRQGFEVTRLSGLAVDEAPAPTRERLQQAIAQAGRDVGSGGEVYLHFIAHGSKAGLALYGKSWEKHPLSYEDLAGMLKTLDPSIRKVVAIDACHSGAAADQLKGIPGLELHMAASADGTTPAGLNDGKPSYTKTALEALRGSANSAADPLASALAHAKERHARNGASSVEALTGRDPRPPAPTPSRVPTPTATPTFRVVTPPPTPTATLVPVTLPPTPTQHPIPPPTPTQDAPPTPTTRTATDPPRTPTPSPEPCAARAIGGTSWSGNGSFGGVVMAIDVRFGPASGCSSVPVTYASARASTRLTWSRVRSGSVTCSFQCSRFQMEIPSDDGTSAALVFSASSVTTTRISGTFGFLQSSSGIVGGRYAFELRRD